MGKRESSVKPVSHLSWHCKTSNGSPLQNSGFVLHQRWPLPHEALCPTRKLYTLRRANCFSVSLPNKSFFAPSSTTARAIFFPPSQFSGRVVSWIAPDSQVLARLKLTPSLN